MKKRSTKKLTSNHAPAGLPATTGSRLVWYSWPDHNQNTLLEAVGGSSDGESGDLYYRLKQGVRCNRHVWIEASSPELLIDEDGPLTWQDLDDAKRRIQRHHDEIMRDWQNDENNRAET